MAGSGEKSAENTCEENEEFNFEHWAKQLNLPKKVQQILSKEELTSKESLQLLDVQDLKEMGLPLGCTKLIMKSVNKWNNIVAADPSDDTSKSTKKETSNTETLDAAGKTLDMLLSENMAPKVFPFQNNSTSGHMDPRTILTNKATSRKAVHITQFLTEKCKRRRQNRRKEFVLRTGQSTETMVLKTEEDHPYLGIYIEEWGAANMRLMNFLLQSGDLKREDVEYYMAYTTRVFEFAETYEWNSVLDFDHTYREVQAEHGFQWGTFSPHMELQILTPKRNKHNIGDTAQRSGAQATEDCKIFKARGYCTFGSACRYKHPKTAQKKAGPAHTTTAGQTTDDA